MLTENSFIKVSDKEFDMEENDRIVEEFNIDNNKVSFGSNFEKVEDVYDLNEQFKKYIES